MHLGDVKGFKGWLADSALATDTFWIRDHAHVNELDIQLFYSRANQRGQGELAVEAIERLQSAMIVESFHRRLDNPSPAIILHEPPQPRFLVDELVDGLIGLSEARRQACLFALEMDVRPESVTMMQWSDVLHSGLDEKLTPLARELCEKASKSRHIRLPYVFWEWASPDIAAPLLDLQGSIEGAFGCTWPELVGKYSRLALIDRAADSASLLELVKEFSGRH